MSIVTLYGSSLSLFTGKARSYLIKSDTAYKETTPTTKYFRDSVLSKTGGRQSIPTIETADGEVIRDGTAIIDHFENTSGNEFSPKTAKQKILSLLFDVIGMEGLLRPAMHYRWNFPEQNLDFLTFHFESMMPEHLDRKATAKKNMDQMRNAGRMFGAVPETFELVETLYGEFLEKFDAHLTKVPYLLGGKPSIGDFGMIAPLFGHLGRDPEPLRIMQKNAVHAFRWVERMNRPELDVGEFKIQDGLYLADDEIPDTLIDLLKHIAIDFIPETLAAADTINQWIDQQADLAPNTIAERGVGMANFEVRGKTLSALAQPFRFYLLQRLQSEFSNMDEKEKAEVEAMLQSCDMHPVLNATLSRKMGRENNREVWL